MFHRIAPTLLAAVVVAVSTAAAAVAHADPISSEPPPERLVTSATTGASPEWYGWQPLLVDGLALGTLPLELGSSSFARTPSATYLFVGSVSTYALGAPIVHAAHHHYRRAALDLLLRAGAVSVGGLIGGAAGGSPSCDGTRVDCLTGSPNGVMVGAVIGAVAASTIDASFLSWEAKPQEGRPVPSWTLAPTAAVTPGGGSIGVSGAF
jgi:hypothetical protein